MSLLTGAVDQPPGSPHATRPTASILCAPDSWVAAPLGEPKFPTNVSRGPKEQGGRGSALEAPPALLA